MSYEKNEHAIVRIENPNITELSAQLAEKATQLDLSRANSPLEYGELKLPSDFPTLPFGLYRDTDNKIKHNFDFKQFEQNITRTYYISKSTGLDSNNGTSEATPLKTIDGLFLKLGVTTGLNVMVIFLESCTYTWGEVSGGSAGSTLNIRANNRIYFKTKNPQDRVTITAGIPTLTWALESGYTNTYKATHTANLQTFLDLRDSNKDVYGLPKNYIKKTTIADVEATPGSYYVNGMTIYVHTTDHVIPDNVNLMANNTSLGFRFQFFDGAKAIFENLNIYGANTYIEATVGALINSEIWTNNCKVALNSANNFGTNNIKKVYHFGMISGYAKRDGLNYTFSSLDASIRRQCLGFEYGCQSYKAGIDDINDNNNASTSHDGACVLRIGTIGFECVGPVLADVHGCYSINIDCKMRDSIAINVANRKVYHFDNLTAISPGKTILVNCSSLGASDNVLIYADAGYNLKMQQFKVKSIPSGLSITYIDRISG